MRTIAYVAQSLDGYIAGPDGELEWLEEIDHPGDSDFGFAEFMATIDAMLMGRNTFETMVSLDVWPYEKPVYVASNSMNTLPEGFEGNAQLISGHIATMFEALRGKGVSSLYVDGGRLIQSAIEHDLLDEFIVTTLPVLLGSGIPLFAGLKRLKKLKLVGSEILFGQLVKTHYKMVIHRDGSPF